MTGLFGSLNVGTAGMQAAQTALQTVSHNISNANTEGYSRQRVNLTASTPYTMAGVGQIGTGVTMSSVERVVDDYVTAQLQNETSVQEQYTAKADVLGQVESIFNEPSDTGLNTALSDFYSAWDYLGSNPELATAKTMVVQKSETLTETMNHMAVQLEDLATDTTQAISKNVYDFNTKLEQLDTLNQQIFNVMVKGQTPNDLLDSRDKLVTELSGIADVDVEIDSYQRAFISVDGQEVLGEDSLKQLSVVSQSDETGSLIAVNGDTTQIVSSSGIFTAGQVVISGEDGSYQAVAIQSGAVKGNQEALAVIQEKQAELDKLAFNFATAVNTVHSDNTAEGQAFFEVPAENTASSLAVNSAILEDPTLINAGQELGEAAAAGDGSRASAIGALATARLDYTSASGPAGYDSETMSFAAVDGGATVSDSYNDMITRMGIVKQQADYMVTSQDEVLSFLQERQASISGVSINEEVVDMLKYQSAFQANARVITTISEMLDTLINRTGV